MESKTKLKILTGLIAHLKARVLKGDCWHNIEDEEQDYSPFKLLADAESLKLLYVKEVDKYFDPNEECVEADQYGNAYLIKIESLNEYRKDCLELSEEVFKSKYKKYLYIPKSQKGTDLV